MESALALFKFDPGQLKGVGAICSELAAEHFGLEILEKGWESFGLLEVLSETGMNLKASNAQDACGGIEDDQNNFTRFILLRSHPVHIPPGLPCKTSIVFSLDNIAGTVLGFGQLRYELGF